MIEPLISPQIKQPDNFRRNRIDAGEIRAFAEIAAVTGKGQIARIIATTVLARHYVFDMMCKRGTFLRKETVFATVSRPASGRVSVSLAPSLRGVSKLPSGL